MHLCLGWMGLWPLALSWPWNWPWFWLVEQASACLTTCTDPSLTSPKPAFLFWGRISNEAFTTFYLAKVSSGSWKLTAWHPALASFIYGEPTAQRSHPHLGPQLSLHQGRFILPPQTVDDKDDLQTFNQWGQLITQLWLFLKKTWVALIMIIYKWPQSKIGLENFMKIPSLGHVGLSGGENGSLPR